MNIYRLTILQVNIIKGVGILLIVLHNFFHNLPPKLGQNEFIFNSNIIINYINRIDALPYNFISDIFSLWGHYGVELFIFVSAYGITISQIKRPRTYYEFIKNKFSHLYISFFICVLLYISLGLLKQQFVSEQVLYWDSILWKLLLISNFIPGEALAPVGPWWFIPFIFQVYFILPLIIWLFKRYGSFSLFIVGVLGLLLETFFLNDFPNLNYTPFGHLPLIVLGIYCSQKEMIRIPIWLIFTSIIIFIGSNFNFYLWVVADLSITLILIAIINKLLFTSNMETVKIKFFAFWGSISLYLFLVNGFLRSPFLMVVDYFDSWWGNILAALLSLIFSTFFALLLKIIEKSVRSGMSRIVSKIATN